MVNINDRNNSRSNMKRGDRGSSSRGEGNKVYVSNIDFQVTHQELKDLFKQVGDVAFVELLKDENQKSKGCAIIRFKENNMVEDCINLMNRYDFKGRKLVVKDERDAPPNMVKSKDRKRGRDDDSFDSRPGMSMSMSMSMPMSSGLDKFGTTYGLSVQFLESLGIDGPLVDRVFVANLDYNVDEDTLKDLFSIAGKVTDVELVRGDDGKSKGFGFIDFDHPVEAVQAISMLHNQLYLERPLSVQLTRKEKRRKDGSLKLPSGLRSIGPGLGVNGNPLKDIARTFEAGNQSSLLGAMPLGGNSGPSSLSMGMDMSSLAQNMNSSLGGGLSSAFGGNLQGNVLSGSLGGSGMVGSLGSGLASNVGGGMGLMDRPNLGLSSGMQNANMGSSAGSSFSAFSGAPFSSQRNSVQISNLPSDYSWKSLQSLCMSFGDVTFAKMTGRSVGVVHFENEASARRAVDMLDHQRFEGKYLETRLL